MTATAAARCQASITELQARWQQPVPYRACQICSHGRDDLAGARVCACPDVVRPAQHRPVELMRRAHGPCGPEALHLHFPGLQP